MFLSIVLCCLLKFGVFIVVILMMLCMLLIINVVSVLLFIFLVMISSEWEVLVMDFKIGSSL